MALQLFRCYTSLAFRDILHALSVPGGRKSLEALRTHILSSVSFFAKNNSYNQNSYRRDDSIRPIFV